MVGWWALCGPQIYVSRGDFVLHYQRQICHCDGGQSPCIRICATLLDFELFLSKRLDLRLCSFSMVKEGEYCVFHSGKKVPVRSKIVPKVRNQHLSTDHAFTILTAPAQFPVPPTSVGYFLALTSIVAGSLPAAWQFGCI